MDRRKQIDKKLSYSVGALMYIPALNDVIIDLILKKKIKEKYSIAICLEDSIKEEAVIDAEINLIKNLEYLKNNYEVEYPKIFIRIRNLEQLKKIYREIVKYEFVTGFIIPKYSLSVCEEYTKLIKLINESSNRKIYFMPILEGKEYIDIDTRVERLLKLKEKLEEIKGYILNIRVGGNDFCKCYSLRRNVKQTIYDIGVVRDILVDILSVFSREYVVSGPVYEYFNGSNMEWIETLQRECQLDKLNGFIGKTIIHPKQLEIVNEQFKVSKEDYEDAISIVEWNEKSMGVKKSISGNRMNEVEVHLEWAQKILILAEIYGVGN